MKRKKAITYRGYQVYVNRRGKTNLFLTFIRGERKFEITSGCTRREEALSEKILGAKLLEGLKRYRREGRHLRGRLQAHLGGKQPQPKLLRGSYGAKVQLITSSAPNPGMPKGWSGGMSWAREFIFSNQPPNVLGKPLSKVTYNEHFNLYNVFVQSNTLNISRRAHWLAFVTAGLIWHGLDPACGKIFTGFDEGLQIEAAGDACPYDTIAGMLRVLHRQPFSGRFLFNCLMSGAPPLPYLALLRHTDIDRDTGKVIIPRQGTTAPGEFLLIGPGLEDYRSQSPQEGEIYVMPELALCQKELIRGNLQPVALTRARLREAGQRARKVLESFLRDAGSPLSAQAFVEGIRKEFVAGLLSLGGKKTVVAHMLGITPSAVEPCNFPAEWELKAVRNIIEQHLDDIRKGVKGRYLVTKTQVLTELKTLLTGHLQALAQQQECLLAKSRHAVDRIMGGWRPRAESQAGEPKPSEAELLALAHRVSKTVDALGAYLRRRDRRRHKKLKMAA